MQTQMGRRFPDGLSWARAGIVKGTQKSYHLPDRLWPLTSFAIDLQCAPDWDGHTSSEVIHRLRICVHPVDVDQEDLAT